MQEEFVLELFVEHTRAGTYFTLPFHMPPDTEALTLSYQYERQRESQAPTGTGLFVSSQEVNIIDLGLLAPDGTQVGASGSDKAEISLSETQATPGYRPSALVAGQWSIIVGAYQIAPEGVTVTYKLSFTKKRLRLYKGDLHTHTIASDGILTATELGGHALRHGLDFLAVTDHNQMVSADALPHIAGITLIPGVEWTHFDGHANFLGIQPPAEVSFIANTPAEVAARFEAARQRGALIVINHPFDEGSGFKFDLSPLPYDCLEVWNGPMRESNLRALGFWHSLLAHGKKVPILGGSDYHRDGLFQILGGPTTCVWSMSAGASDILYALKAGHAYIVFAPNGPSLELTAGSAIMGDTVAFAQCQELQIVADGLKEKDTLRVVTGQSSQTLLEAPANGRVRAVYTMQQPGFAHIEILRAFLPGLPLLPALLSNPIYFEG